MEGFRIGLLEKVGMKFIATVLSIAATMASCSVAEPPCKSPDPACDPVATYLSYGLLLTDRWVAVGLNGNIATSPNGQTNWNSFVLAGTSFRAVTYGGAGFVAVGDTGRIALSYTGVSGDWSDQTSGTSDELRDVTYGHGMFVVVGGINGGNDRILTSFDGITWTDRSIGLSNRLDHVIFANNQFYAVGLGGVRAASVDGLSWTNESAGGNPWAGLAFGNDVFLIADDASSIHTSSTFSGFPNITGSFGSAVTDAVLFIPQRGVFFLAGDDGGTFLTTDGVGAATPGDNFGTNAADAASDGSTILVASQTGSLPYSTDFSTFNPVTVGGADWFGVTYARAPKILGP